jgi:protein-S-isoprenylcysteine O-methyltransferase Ste14
VLARVAQRYEATLGLGRSSGTIALPLAGIALNLLHIPLVEEPQVARRFAASYRGDCRHVRRFLPRLRPWPSRPT